MQDFNIEDYKYINDFIEQKISYLRKNKKFNQKYLKLSDTMDALENSLLPGQKEQLNELIKLFYETEEYYFVFSYLLGAKYGENLNQLPW